MSLPTSLRGLMAERPVLGTFLKIPRFEIVDVLALFVVCDYEHSQMSAGDACDVVRAGRARGLPVLVRVPALDRGDINRLLEAGAAGIQLARGSGAAAGELRKLVSYPPLGTRSVSLAQPAADYGMGVSLAEHFERSNSTVLAVGQFETADYADGIDAAMAALDVAFISALTAKAPSLSRSARSILPLSANFQPSPGEFRNSPIVTSLFAERARAKMQWRTACLLGLGDLPTAPAPPQLSAVRRTALARDPRSLFFLVGLILVCADSRGSKPMDLTSVPIEEDALDCS